jgi:hypothetical protein
VFRRLAAHLFLTNPIVIAAYFRCDHPAIVILRSAIANEHTPWSMTQVLIAYILTHSR